MQLNTVRAIPPFWRSRRALASRGVRGAASRRTSSIVVRRTMIVQRRRTRAYEAMMKHVHRVPAG
jgi:hypothetical protein